ncbi:uncharacterized protein DEA37_0013820 [Paragonimus westermani]|uniref:Uncharacterized protein n=1 Tax=Paragonimus westermani TaxID=34504 RepID=A0A5J4NPD7_9TREM|nr:uncharacterized protein DEA37_0013820 [Paragonimus westermani]
MNLNETKDVNYVHQTEIMTETIQKELRHQKLYTHYGINPFKKGKKLLTNNRMFFKFVHSQKNRIKYNVMRKRIVKHFLEVLRRAALEPTKKYLEAQTENQEYGWISQPLMDIDRSDRRFYYPKISCEMTQFAGQLWKQKEQEKLNA